MYDVEGGGGGASSRGGGGASLMTMTSRPVGANAGAGAGVWTTVAGFCTTVAGGACTMIGRRAHPLSPIPATKIALNGTAVIASQAPRRRGLRVEFSGRGTALDGGCFRLTAFTVCRLVTAGAGKMQEQDCEKKGADFSAPWIAANKINIAEI